MRNPGGPTREFGLPGLLVHRADISPLETILCRVYVPVLSDLVTAVRHSQANTTYRYVNANVETAKRAAAALDMFDAEGTLRPEPAEMVN